MSIQCDLLTLNNMQIQELHQYPETIHALIGSQPHTEPSETFLRLDKAWHGIHFALTGTDREAIFPLGFIVSGGAEIGEEDLGYGTARAFRAEEVQVIAGSILAIDEARFIVGLKDEGARELVIYGREEELTGDDTEYFSHYFQHLQTFLKASSDQDLGMVVYMN
jgi:hypothetical protein